MAKGMLDRAIEAVQKRDRRNTAAATGGSSTKSATPTKNTLDETKATAKSPAGVQKSKSQGEKEREALRRKQQERIKRGK